MSRFGGIATRSEIREVISELEELSDEAPVISVAAVHVLKNELGARGADGEHRELLFEREFTLPGGFGKRLLNRLGTEKSERRQGLVKRALVLGCAWLRGEDAELFRDTCDRYFWKEMVPEIETGFGALAAPFMNTINEAIINYAEYSFRPWSLFRSISAQVFLTEGDLAYGIIRPHGFRQRAFNPLELKRRKAPRSIRTMRRGWGHTLLMQRALFISFDHSVSRRGMMIVVGPEESDDR